MQAVAYYLVYPFIYALASLPFSVLYKASDLLFSILWLSGYRKKVVIMNLTNSFPEKSKEEIEALCKSYYRYLCDIILETFKTLTMTEHEARTRCVFVNQPWLDKLYEENKSFIIVMGHYGNWEWAGPSFTLNTKFQLVVIYRPLTNPYFEKMMTGMRTKFGTRITPVNQTLRDMVANRKQLTATAFIADQTATRDNAYWMNFLNQDTAVFTGPEKLAKKFSYPVVYMNVKRIERGYYQVTPELLFSEPNNTAEGEICEVFTKRLEKDIINDPQIWLWSHKRWKHKRVKN
ncbi:MAG TPA: lysophospholipid acyltransferase family protein [Cyclobacteriaceae bacterium]|jgi:KDO2-lipid IV(A) lauroyltransferase|nr:lysophospholipid acyltransferase family protein [Cyclobacteriaceae bacterium]